MLSAAATAAWRNNCSPEGCCGNGIGATSAGGRPHRRSTRSTRPFNRRRPHHVRRRASPSSRYMATATCARHQRIGSPNSKSSQVLPHRRLPKRAAGTPCMPARSPTTMPTAAPPRAAEAVLVPMRGSRRSGGRPPVAPGAAAPAAGDGYCVQTRVGGKLSPRCCPEAGTC